MSDPAPAIAVIGLGGRFPGAANVDEFWRNLCAGKETISRFSDDELLEVGFPPEAIHEERFVAAKAVVRNSEWFDAGFFGYTPREAEAIDPQQRVFLEVAWEALENSGYVGESFDGLIGVYAGVAHSDRRAALRADSETSEVMQNTISQGPDFLTTRVSYKLNLHGPSFAIQSACSTSLVAIHQACRSLLNYECDIALAGGVAISGGEVGGYFYQEGAICSPDGHCRTFDARAEGTVPGQGAGVVVLRRLEDALEDRDTISAVILGSATNNDGSNRVGYTAPSITGQAQVVALAQAIAQVSPDSIGCIEAHGTATKLGDPVEIAALTRAFRGGTKRHRYCAIGSVKSNIGHADAAAGVAGLIKTVLALKHRQIPPSLHYQRANPEIDFDNSPFYVNTVLRKWESNGNPRRAGVSSFGLGGTNAHVVLEEPPGLQTDASPERGNLLVLSARSAEALETATQNLARHLELHPEQNLADVAYTLQVGRKAFQHRRTVVCDDRHDAVSALAGATKERLRDSPEPARQRGVVFMFPGQGAQHVNMGRNLYHSERVFKTEVDRCSELLGDSLGPNLSEILYPRGRAADEAAALLNETSHTQPALFAVEYALAKQWMAWGVQPQAMLGHSIGEYVAACLAGVFRLEDALQLVAERGRLMQSLPAGAMLAVYRSAAEIDPRLSPGLSLAAVNAPQLCVVSGTPDEVERFEQELQRDGTATRRLHTLRAFHSSLVDGIVPQFCAFLEHIERRAPQIPFLSNVTGEWITSEQAVSCEYWGRHLRCTVRFSEALQVLLKQPDNLFLEVGPGNTLGTLARAQDAPPARHPVVQSLPHPKETEDDYSTVVSALGNLWLSGVGVDWKGLHAGKRRGRVPLPSYPFERQDFSARRQPDSPAGRAADGAPEAAAEEKRANIDDWFYVPSWKRLPLPARATGTSRWLLFCDERGLATKIGNALRDSGHQVQEVVAGEALAMSEGERFTLHPSAGDHFDSLIRELNRRGTLPHNILYAWCGGDRQGSFLDRLEEAEDRDFFSLLQLAKAWGTHAMNDELHIHVLTRDLHEVTGEESVRPLQALALGACKIIPLEYTNIRCHCIDLDGPEGTKQDLASEFLLNELQCPGQGAPVAYRGRHRWVQTYERVPLESSPPTLGLRQRGVYLITGGMGGIGLALAEHLAAAVQARLILVGRSPVPPREQWDRILSAPGNDRAKQFVKSLSRLEALGAEVCTLECDVADADRMRAVVDESVRRFGTIHGVIHSAGVVDKGGVIHRRSREASEAILSAKVRGTLALDAAVKGLKLDFFVVSSSLATVLYGINFGEVGYCAANSFLDAFAWHRNSKRRGFTTSINWDSWRDVGMAASLHRRGEATPAAPEVEETGWSGLRPAEGVEVFRRVLGSDLPQVIVSTVDLSERIDKYNTTVIARFPDQSPQAESKKHPRPKLSTPYEAPKDDLQQKVERVWSEMLGIQQVGVNDNFFELGGHSLVATSVVSRLSESLQVRIPPQALFENPTVARLAGRIQVLRWAVQDASSSTASTSAVEGEI